MTEKRSHFDPKAFAAAIKQPEAINFQKHAYDTLNRLDCTGSEVVRLLDEIRDHLSCQNAYSGAMLVALMAICETHLPDAVSKSVRACVHNLLGEHALDDTNKENRDASS